MSATATTSADAVAAGICPRQSFAAVAFLGDDSTQKNRYGCILKLEGAWRAASRICSRSTCGISTGSKAFTARLWNSASRISLMGTAASGLWAYNGKYFHDLIREELPTFRELLH